METSTHIIADLGTLKSLILCILFLCILLKVKGPLYSHFGWYDSKFHKWIMFLLNVSPAEPATRTMPSAYLASMFICIDIPELAAMRSFRLHVQTQSTSHLSIHFLCWTGHTSNIGISVILLLKQQYTDGWITSRNFPTSWQSRSPASSSDFNPCDIWLCGYLKCTAYDKNLYN